MMKNILRMFAVLMMVGTLSTAYAILVDIPLDSQINVGRTTPQSPSGDAIYWPIAGNVGSFRNDEPEGYSRTEMIPGGSWQYGPYVDFYLAGITPDAIDLTAGGTIEFDARYFQGGDNTNPYGDAPIFLRIYAYGPDNSTLLGYRDYGIVYATQAPLSNPPYPDWTHVTVDINGGTVTNYGGNLYDQSKITRLRFYGTDWSGKGQDFWDTKNLQITLIPEPGTIAMFTLGLLGLLVTRRKK